jgi:zinc transport system substrate-binding protein
MTKFYSQVACFLAIFITILAVSESAEGKIAVFVSIIPQKYFVQQIGKNLVDIQVMVQPGASPASYEPKPRQMAAIAKTHIYFSIGVPFENVWLNKIASSNPNMMVVQTDHGIPKTPMADHHHQGGEADHQKADQHHENEHGQDEIRGDPGILDPHIWLSPPLVMIQARTILVALQKVDPVHHTDYEANFKACISEISKLDAELKNSFSGKHGLQFMVFHPAWGYFADTYGLKQIPVEIEGKNPKPAQLKELIEYANQNNINVIFVQPQFSAKSAEVIARGIGGQVVLADPLAEEWAANLRKVAREIKAALR